MIGVDLVPERLARVRARGIEVLDITAATTTSPSTIRDLTDGRGPDAVIDAVGMEAHGAPVGRAGAQRSPASFPTRSPQS